MIRRQHEVGGASAGGRESSERSHLTVDTDAVAVIMSGCENSLRNAGVMGALRFLNGRTRYRYTGLYHAEPPFLRNVQLFDRENPTLNVSGELKPLHETYCGIVRDTNDTVLIADALADARFIAHPARESVLSYCGVAIRTEDGQACGSLCHFDVRPRLLSVRETQVLEGAAPLFARWLSDQHS